MARSSRRYWVQAVRFGPAGPLEAWLGSEVDHPLIFDEHPWPIASSQHPGLGDLVIVWERPARDTGRLAGIIQIRDEHRIQSVWVPGGREAGGYRYATIAYFEEPFGVHDVGDTWPFFTSRRGRLVELERNAARRLVGLAARRFPWLQGRLAELDLHDVLPARLPAGRKASAEVAPSARSGGRRSAQPGFEPDPAKRRAIELRAVEIMAGALEKDGWTVKPTRTPWPYDLDAKKGRQRRHVEVKGTRDDGSVVWLTANEIDYARDHDDMVLAVVSGIELDGLAVVPGGERLDVIDPWRIDEHGELVDAPRQAYHLAPR